MIVDKSNYLTAIALSAYNYNIDKTRLIPGIDNNQHKRTNHIGY